MDTRTEENTLSMTCAFGDGSEKTISQDHPDDTNQASLIAKINDLSNFIAQNNLILSENNAAFTNIKASKLVEKVTTDFDLGTA